MRYTISVKINPRLINDDDFIVTLKKREFPLERDQTGQSDGNNSSFSIYIYSTNKAARARFILRNLFEMEQQRARRSIARYNHLLRRGVVYTTRHSSLLLPTFFIDFNTADH